MCGLCEASTHSRARDTAIDANCRAGAPTLCLPQKARANEPPARQQDSTHRLLMRGGGRGVRQDGRALNIKFPSSHLRELQEKNSEIQEQLESG